MQTPWLLCVVLTMRSAKDIHITPIPAKDAREFVCRVHYSGKVVNNSQLHLGVFLDGHLGGVMQFGPPMDKRKILPLVSGTGWSQMLELNRMAFADMLPRNSESRAISIAMRLIRKHYPWVKWVVSFADATQCGDGTIYRAAGFVLTGIKKNNQTWQSPDGTQVITRMTATTGKHARKAGGATMRPYRDAGWRPITGYQIRYIRFLDPAWRKRLTVKPIPFARIAEVGASMYRGKRAGSIDSDAPHVQCG